MDLVAAAAVALALIAWVALVRRARHESLYDAPERALIRARRREIRRDPGNPQPYLDLVHLHLGRGDVAAIRTLFEDALPRSATDPALVALRESALRPELPLSLPDPGPGSPQVFDFDSTGVTVRLGQIKAMGLLSIDRLTFQLRRGPTGSSVRVLELAARVTEEDLTSFFVLLSGRTAMLSDPKVEIASSGVTVRATAGVVPFEVSCTVAPAGGPALRVRPVTGPRLAGVLPIPRALWYDRLLCAMPMAGSGFIRAGPGDGDVIVDLAALFPMPVALDVGEVELTSGTLRIRAGAAPVPELTISDRLGQAIEALDASEPTRALAAADGLQGAVPAAVRARALALTGRRDEAAGAASEVLADPEAGLLALALLAEAAIELGDSAGTSRAIEHASLRAAAPGLPSTRDVEAYARLARIACRWRPPAEVIFWSRAWRRAAPLDPEPCGMLARVYEELGDLGAAHVFFAAAGVLLRQGQPTEGELRTRAAYAAPRGVSAAVIRHPHDDPELDRLMAGLSPILRRAPDRAASLVPASKATHPALFAALTEVGDSLGVAVPDVLIGHGEEGRIGWWRGQLIVPWEVLSRLPRREAMFLLGRGVHAGARGLDPWLDLSPSMLGRMVAVLTLRERLASLWLPARFPPPARPAVARLMDLVVPGSGATYAVVAAELGPLALREWLCLPRRAVGPGAAELYGQQRALRFSADRAGLLACGSPGGALRALRTVWGDGDEARLRLAELLDFMTCEELLGHRPAA